MNKLLVIVLLLARILVQLWMTVYTFFDMPIMDSPKFVSSKYLEIY